MISIQTLSGEKKTVYLNENDVYYKDILKYVRDNKYPEWDPTNINPKKEEGYRIYVKSITKLFHNGLQLMDDKEINFKLDIMQMCSFNEYMCYTYKGIYQFPKIDNIDNTDNMHNILKKKLYYLAKSHITEENRVIELVPDNIKDKKLCELACCCWEMLKYIPEKFKTEELCKKCLTTIVRMPNITLQCPGKVYISYDSNINDNYFTYIPTKFLTNDFYTFAIGKNFNILKFVPIEHKTEELCKLAVKEGFGQLEYVPENMKTEELCKISVKKSGYTLKFVPVYQITAELCYLAVKEDGNALEYVPKNMKTEELCKLAVQQIGYTLKYVPKNMKTAELCYLAVKADYHALKYVPIAQKTEELCAIAKLH